MTQLYLKYIENLSLLQDINFNVFNIYLLNDLQSAIATFDVFGNI